MDVKDRRILHELSKNARIPITKLSKKIQLSQSSTIYRLERLEKEGIILGTNTIINAYKLGFEGFRVLIDLKGITQAIQNTLLNWLVGQSEASVVGLNKRSQELFIMSWTHSTCHFAQFIERLKQKYGLYFFHVQIDPYVGTIYYPRNYLSDGAPGEEVIVRPTGVEKYDELDMSILQTLAYDARISALSIAKKLNKPVKTIINRIRSLEKRQIIAGYSANINISKLSMEYYKVNIVFTKPIAKTTLESFAQKMRNVVYLDEYLGRYDFEMNVEVASEEELQSILVQLKELSQGFEHLEIKQLDKYLKLGFLS